MKDHSTINVCYLISKFIWFVKTTTLPRTVLPLLPLCIRDRVTPYVWLICINLFEDFSHYRILLTLRWDCVLHCGLSLLVAQHCSFSKQETYLHLFTILNRDGGYFFNDALKL